MKFNLSSTLSYEVFSTTAFFFNILAIKSENQTIIEESLMITPAIPFEIFTTSHSDARFVKLEVEMGISFTIEYQAQVEVEYANVDEDVFLKTTLPIIKMDHNVLQYISPSRHCESDKLMNFAHNTFGSLPDTYSKVIAIEEWIFNNVAYIPGSINSSASAAETLLSRVGVCKDFAHLGIALCRALDIPARYFTAYSTNLNPPDFHACFETYINGHWIIFDPTKLADLNGLVKIANGKDATEVAVTTYYGEIMCTYMDVQCYPESTDFIPFNWETRREEAMAY